MKQSPFIKLQEVKFRMKIRKALNQCSAIELLITKEELQKAMERKSK